MSDKQREALSALLDDEANELEMHRTLKAALADETLAKSWERYSLIGSVMREESAPGPSLDIANAVKQALADEPALNGPVLKSEPNAGRQAWLTSRPLSRLAVAASVAMAVFFGLQYSNNPTSSPEVASAPPLAENIKLASVPADLDASPGELIRDTESTPESKALYSGEMAHQERIKDYILQHSEHAALSTGRGMMPFARVVDPQNQQNP